MNFFECSDINILVKERVAAFPNGGRGAYAKLARFLGIHSTSLSQILAGKKALSLEHAALICDFFEFTELESEFFLLLVQLERAGHHRLKERLQLQIMKVREKSRELSEIVPSQKKLSHRDQAIFYSDWRYSAIRVLSSIEQFQNIPALAKQLNVAAAIVEKKVKFLVRAGLCEFTNGKVSPGPSYTHLESTSPLISKHHANWRLRAMSRHPELSDDELAYSSLMSISISDAKKVRELLVSMVKKANDVRASSECEVVRCLAIDWITI